MEEKSCSFCGRPADFSVLLLVSTLRVSPREQRSTSSVRLCRACVSPSDIPDKVNVQSRLTEALTVSCSALTRPHQ